MPYSVSQSVVENGTVNQWYCRGFETMEETLDYYHDIDLRQEFSVEFMCSDNGCFKTKTLIKEAFDEEGTQMLFDYYDYERYKGGE